MTKILFFKVTDSLPLKLKRDSIYFVHHTDSDAVSIYVTDYLGNPKAAGSNTTSLDTSKFVFDEIPTGLMNGSNNLFVSLNNFQPGTVQLKLNGLEQKPITEFITIGINEVQLAVAPLSTDFISINYIKS